MDFWNLKGIYTVLFDSKILKSSSYFIHWCNKTIAFSFQLLAGILNSSGSGFPRGGGANSLRLLCQIVPVWLDLNFSSVRMLCFFPLSFRKSSNEYLSVLSDGVKFSYAPLVVRLPGEYLNGFPVVKDWGGFTMIGCCDKPPHCCDNPVPHLNIICDRLSGMQYWIGFPRWWQMNFLLKPFGSL